MKVWRRARGAVARRGAVVATSSASTAVSLRDEKILMTLVVQTQQLNDRLTRLEERVEADARDALSLPDQNDLLELRLHSARLAAELSRVTVELRAQINDLAKGPLGASFDDDTLTTPLAATGTSDADSNEVIDLRESPGRSSDASRRASGWRPTRPKHPPRDR